jgi:hypothetical protein
MGFTPLLHPNSTYNHRVCGRKWLGSVSLRCEASCDCSRGEGRNWAGRAEGQILGWDRDDGDAVLVVPNPVCSQGDIQFPQTLPHALSRFLVHALATCPRSPSHLPSSPSFSLPLLPFILLSLSLPPYQFHPHPLSSSPSPIPPSPPSSPVSPLAPVSPSPRLPSLPHSPLDASPPLSLLPRESERERNR